MPAKSIFFWRFIYGWMGQRYHQCSVPSCESSSHSKAWEITSVWILDSVKKIACLCLLSYCRLLLHSSTAPGSRKRKHQQVVGSIPIHQLLQQPLQVAAWYIFPSLVDGKIPTLDVVFEWNAQFCWSPAQSSQENPYDCRLKLPLFIVKSCFSCVAFPSSNAENGGQAPVEVLDASPTGAANKKRWGGRFLRGCYALVMSK